MEVDELATTACPAVVNWTPKLKSKGASAIAIIAIAVKWSLYPACQGRRNRMMMMGTNANGPAATTRNTPSVGPSIDPVPSFVAIDEPPHSRTVTKAPMVASEKNPAVPVGGPPGLLEGVFAM